MKSFTLLLLWAGFAVPASAAGDPPPAVQILRVPLGSGTPSPDPVVEDERERGYEVAHGVYHVPGQMPGFPTAATIWPRQVRIDCVQDARTGELQCDGYAVRPSIGRGEYIYSIPVVQSPQPAGSKTEVIVIPIECPCDERNRPPRLTRKKPLG